MMQKRIKQLVLAGAVLAALALGGSASAGAAKGSSGSSSTTATLQPSGGGGLASLSFTRAPGAAAHESAKTTVTGDRAPKASAAPLTMGRGGSVGAMHHVRDSWIRDLYLTATSSTSDTTRV
jgi:hypothetical protein